jgi:2-keto-4-pentenoate hydratase
MAMSHAEVARQLLQEHDLGQGFHTLAPEAGVVGLASAYGVQRHLVELLRPKGGATAGYKIGLTSARMQKMCGIDQPIAGVVLANRVVSSGAILQGKRYGRVGLEFEVGVRLGRDLPAAGAPYDAQTVGQAVDGVCAAVEVVDDRRADYKSLDVRSLVADNSWNAGAILGEFKEDWPDLAAVSGVVMLNGVEVDRGHGRDVLGHPFVPLTWLANHLAAAGNGLRAGDVVLTGSLVTTRFPRESETYRYELAGIGTVDLSVTM